MELLFTVIACSLFVFTLVTGILKRVFSSRLTFERRLAAYAEKAPGDELRARVRATRKRTPIKISSMLRDQLASAGVPMRAEEYLLVWIMLACIPPVIAALLGARFFVCLVLASAGLALPPLYVRRSRTKRVRAFEAQLGDALISISNCLKSGLTFQQGMQNIAEQMPEPISKEFSRTLREVQLGSTMDTALGNLTRRIPSPDLRLMITAVLISQQVGGSLSDVMDSIANTILDRIRVKNEVHTLTSQGRMSGVIIGCLPIGIGLVLCMLNPDYMRTFIDTGTGRIMLIVAGCMELVGFLVIKKMVTIKY